MSWPETKLTPTKNFQKKTESMEILISLTAPLFLKSGDIFSLASGKYLSLIQLLKNEKYARYFGT